MIIGVVKESFPGERRVALTPASAAALIKAGNEVYVQTGAGAEAGFVDGAYEAIGATVARDRGAVFDAAVIICQVRTPGANPGAGAADLALLNAGHTIVGLAEPLPPGEAVQALARSGATVFALELVPRITRAQAMDVLSSQANLAGYTAVLIAARALPKIFPMLMTAAGTISPARVLVLGAGVAGLQAIATARRLGAVVFAYDIRPAVKEQVQSLGARFIELPLETGEAETGGGYARAMDESFYRRQAELLGEAVAGSNVVITTAAVPGRRAPLLVPAEMARRMGPGSVIVDLAAERGGNCELTRPDEVVRDAGITVLGPTNLPAQVPHDASQMYGRNVAAFLELLLKDGALSIDAGDEIVAATMLVRDGTITAPAVREALGMEAAAESGVAATGDQT